MSELEKMTFLSYQPITMHEHGDIEDENEFNAGQFRTEAIMHKDEEYIKRLGYNPYWAIGGKNTKDIMLSSLFTSPNNPFIAHVFQTDDYIRINKIKQEAFVSHKIDGHSLDFIDNTSPDIASEFLVKEMNTSGPRFIYVLQNLFDPNCHVADGFIFDNDYFKNLPKEFLDYWDDTVNSCNNFLHNYIYLPKETIIERGHITPETVDIFIEAEYAKMVYEMTILPVILESIAPCNRVGENEFKIKSAWLYELCYTCKAYLALEREFTIACDEGTLTDSLYSKLVAKGYDLIIDDRDILNALSNNKKIYPNDLCPCGSNKKFKKCHGRINFEPANW